MQSISLPTKPPSSPHPILNLSFRVFFSGAVVFAVITMIAWAFIFMGHGDIDPNVLNPVYWHGHEMIFGYALAVVAGFLLTAVKTWTGQMMPYGYRLLGIFLCWLLARLGWLAFGFGVDLDGAIDSQAWLMAALVFDGLFMLSMALAIFRAVLAIKQYKQMGILAKLALLTLANGLCYLGIIKGDMNLSKIGIYLGFYLIIGLVLTIGRRVVPFFIERGLSPDLPAPITVKNSRWQDVASLVLFLVFFIVDVFFPNPYLLTIAALAVGLVNFKRLLGWYHPNIWQKPLLWSLFLAFLGICISFFLFALQPWFGFSHSLAVHGLAVSGVGMMSLSMMARVSLGHTGRSIHKPPSAVNVMFLLMVLVFISRALLPIVDSSHYLWWVMMAQAAWIGGFLLFCSYYLPILFKPRPDGLFG